MKQIFFLLLMAVACTAHAQYSGDENFGSRIRAGVAYVHDFPGLNGIGAYAEYNFPLNEWIQGGAGVRRVETGGYPRTATVREYTKATALDVNLLFVPFHTENAAFRIGAGYSFSFYNVRRSYPVYTAHTDQAAGIETSWPQMDAKGTTRGVSLMAEYEYNFSNNFSAGAKITICKAYGSVVMAGPFVAVKL
ncbi:MAG: outer membrane beta-barrel protein [Chitinophagaceae bacterium]